MSNNRNVDLIFPQNCVGDILHVNVLVLARAFSYYTLKIHFVIVHFTQLYVLSHITVAHLWYW